LNGDWAKWVTFGQAAFLFRTEAVRVGPSLFKIPVSYDDRLRYTREGRNRNFGTFLNEAYGVQMNNAFRYRFAIDPNPEAETPEALRERPVAPFVAETGEMAFDGLFRITAPQAVGVFGEFSGKVALGVMDVEVASRGFRTVLLTALDGLPVAESGRMLLTNPGYVLRSRSAAAPAVAQRIVRYPGTTDWFTIEADLPSKPSGDLNGGAGPTWMMTTPVKVTLRTQFTDISVYPLDGAGRRGEALAVRAGVDGLEFVIGGEAPWYEIVGGLQ
jgi:hypothetical protein